MNQDTFEEVLKYFQQAKDAQDRPLNIYACAINHQGETWSTTFNQQVSLHNIRSIAKTIIACLIGVLIKASESDENKKITLDSPIYPSIKHAVTLTNQDNLPLIKQWTIRHCLTHTLGHHKMLLMKDDLKDLDHHQLISEVCNTPILKPIGTHFQYTNAGYYLLSAFIQEHFKQDVLSLAKKYLFEPLNITQVSWDKLGPYIHGASNCWLNGDALIKLGLCIKDGGMYQDKEIIPKDWVEEMCKVHVDLSSIEVSNVFKMNGYGLGIWLNEDDLIAALGTDGQSIIIDKISQAVIITQANQKETKSFNQVIYQIIELIRKTSV